MKKTWKKGMAFIFILVFLTEIFGIYQSSEKQITVEAAGGYKISSALKYAAVKLGLSKSGSTFNKCKAALSKAGVLKEGDYKNYDAYITRTDAAVLADRIMDYMGEEKDKEQISLVQELGRITDLEKVEKKKRDAVARIFSEGIIIGKWLGWYTQNREFQGSTKLTAAEAKRVILLAFGKGTRKLMSPDAQVIRKKDLPVNYSEYPYILQNFPNKFYEKMFEYEFVTYYYTPKELKDYTPPSRIPYDITADMLEEYRYIWAEKIRKNLELRLNVDYRTLNDTWVKELAATYYTASYTDTNKEKIVEIKKYVELAKKNKIKLEARVIAVEPSSMYADEVPTYRCHVEFRIVSGTGISDTGESAMFCEGIYLPGIKVGQWVTGDYDLTVGWVAFLGLPEGKDAGVRWDGFSTRRDVYKTKLLKPVRQKNNEYIFQ